MSDKARALSQLEVIIEQIEVTRNTLSEIKKRLTAADSVLDKHQIYLMKLNTLLHGAPEEEP